MNCEPFFALIICCSQACDGTEKNMKNCAHETGTDIYWYETET